LYLGGEKLKPLHVFYVKFYTFFAVLVLILSPAGGSSAPRAQEAGIQPAGEAAGLVVPDERDIRLGEEAPGLPAETAGPVSGFVVLRSFLLILLAAAAVYGVVYAVKKFSRPREARNPYLRVLATTQLGPNRFVHVVALGTRGWLVGSGEGGISPIADITEQEALDTLFLEESRKAAQGPGRPPDFRSLLRRLGLMNAAAPGVSGPEPSPGESPAPDEGETLAENIRRRRDRLRGL
jgi:flagellar biogenesis protein FliO